MARRKTLCRIKNNRLTDSQLPCYSESRRKSMSLFSNLSLRRSISIKHFFLVLIVGFVLIQNYKDLRSALNFAETVRGLEINLPQKIYNKIQGKFLSEKFDCSKKTLILFDPAEYPETSVNIPSLSKFALFPCDCLAYSSKEKNFNPPPSSQVIRL